MWPSMVTHTQNLCSVFIPSKVHTHSSEHTHREHTPGAVGSHLCSGAGGAVGGSVPCSRVSGIEGGERALYIHSLHLQCIYNILHIYKYVHLFMCNTFLDIYVMYMHIHPKTIAIWLE